MLKKIFLAFAALLVLVLATPAVLGLIFHDIAPFDDSDFTLTALTLADEDNAYFDLLALQETKVPDEIDKEVLAHLSGEKWDDLFITQTLATYTTQLQQYEAAAAKPGFQDPDFIDPSPYTLLPYSDLMTFLPYVRLNSLHSLALMKEGKEEESLKIAFLSVDLGAKMMDSKSSLMSWYIASTVQKTGLETLAKLIPDVTDPSLLQSYKEKLHDYALTDEDITHAFKGDYSLLRGIFKNIDQNQDLLEQVGSLNDEDIFAIHIFRYDGWSFYYHPNEVQKAVYDNYKTRARQATLSCESNIVDEIDAPSPSDPSFYWTENALGEFIVRGFSLRISGKPFCALNQQIKELEGKL